jgi:hypothetical protein
METQLLAPAAFKKTEVYPVFTISKAGWAVGFP